MKKLITIAAVSILVLTVAGVASAAWGRRMGAAAFGDQEIAVWAKITGLTADQLKVYMFDGAGIGELAAATALAKEQGKSVKDILEKAKADKVGVEAIAYAAGIAPTAFAPKVQAIYEKYIDEAVAAGVYTSEQGDALKQAMAARFKAMLEGGRPGFGRGSMGMIGRSMMGGKAGGFRHPAGFGYQPTQPGPTTMMGRGFRWFVQPAAPTN
ncbi:MAG: hypothetical protein NUW23_02245 [Firmicutes bacterium]|nr:hypothetical protein [Bacillota bacterium]